MSKDVSKYNELRSNLTSVSQKEGTMIEIDKHNLKVQLDNILDLDNLIYDLSLKLKSKNISTKAATLSKFI